jgi:hypothetical protein
MLHSPSNCQPELPNRLNPETFLITFDNMLVIKIYIMATTAKVLSKNEPSNGYVYKGVFANKRVYIYHVIRIKKTRRRQHRHGKQAMKNRFPWLHSIIDSNLNFQKFLTTPTRRISLLLHRAIHVVWRAPGHFKFNELFIDGSEKGGRSKGW